jgi:D-sedoheptulose 7-phosphate isomerase
VTRPDAPAPDPTAGTDRLRGVARARFDASTRATADFFEASADRLALCCRDLAKSFQRGHRLLALGHGAQATDALHVAVEFVHPVIVGKRALPALALQPDPAAALRALGEPGDAALALAAAGAAEPLRAALSAARARGLLTVALLGRDAAGWEADHLFTVDSDDPTVVQEVHEIAYHVLWELVHVFLEHPEHPS